MSLGLIGLTCSGQSELGLSNKAAAAAKSLHSCPTLCDPIDGNLPGSPVPGILQAKTLEWVAISFSNRGDLVSNIVTIYRSQYEDLAVFH